PFMRSIGEGAPASARSHRRLAPMPSETVSTNKPPRNVLSATRLSAMVVSFRRMAQYEQTIAMRKRALAIQAHSSDQDLALEFVSFSAPMTTKEKPRRLVEALRRCG